MKRMTGEKRKAIAARLKELEEAGRGVLLPAAVVEDARDPDSPLHDQFTWDIEKAAYEHWLDEARALIVTVKYVLTSDTTVVRAVYYHKNPNATGNEPGYVSVPTLRSDEDSARAALVDAFRRVGDELRRAQILAVALELDKEVEQLLNGVKELRVRIGDAPTQMM